MLGVSIRPFIESGIFEWIRFRWTSLLWCHLSSMEPSFSVKSGLVDVYIVWWEMNKTLKEQQHPCHPWSSKFCLAWVVSTHQWEYIGVYYYISTPMRVHWCVLLYINTTESTLVCTIIYQHQWEYIGGNYYISTPLRVHWCVLLYINTNESTSLIILW